MSRDRKFNRRIPDLISQSKTRERGFGVFLRRKHLLRSLLVLICWASFPLAALAGEGRLGIVRSQENSSQWTGILTRLQNAGADYCELNLSDLHPNADLQDVGILFLPNIETLNGAQVTRLKTWVEKGGKIIVSGPTGSLSQPQVRSQLRSLLGAYWGFPLTNPSTLEPLRVKSQAWAAQVGLSSTIRGGVIIPAGLESKTAAVWQADGTPPAIVVTQQSIFLGWRWGVDAVASIELDAAWLQAALTRYGVLTAESPTQPDPCLASRQSARAIAPAPAAQPQPPSVPRSAPAARQQPPTAPRPVPRTVPNLPDSPAESVETKLPAPSLAANPQTTLPPSSRPSIPVEQLILDPDLREQVPQRPTVPRSGGGARISSTQARAMREELERLLGRFESAVLMAEAAEQENLSMSQAIAQVLDATGKDVTNPNPPGAHPTATSARAGLQRFLQLVDRGEYNRARQQWQQVRNELWNNYPVDRPIEAPEVRAIWLDRGSIVKARSEAGLALEFDRLSAAGINTVFFETVNASYPIYPSTVAPEQNPLVQGWDPLAAAVKLAKERGMELHAWVWIFAAANQRHNSILRQPLAYPGPVLSQHPTWAMADRRGGLFQVNSKKAFFDPANPEVRDYLISLLEEIASRYEVDGIQFDYIRYPFQDPSVNQTYGYGTAARSQFSQLTGTDPIAIVPGDRLWNQWTQFRIQQVDRFVAEASRRLKSQHPDLILSAAVFPIDRAERLAKLQQNWEAWVERGDIDLLVPMAYALDTESFSAIAQPLFERQSSGHSLFLPGIRLLRLPTPVAVDQVQLLRDLPASGYALFATANLSLNLQSILRRTQGPRRAASTSPIPYRQPFQAASDRYKTLQNEWIASLRGQAVNLDEAKLKAWGTEADALAIALKQLAANPNPTTFNRAQTTLSSFQRQFDRWMQDYAQTHPYQVEAWKNRLQALEQLLNYGKRTAI